MRYAQSVQTPLRQLTDRQTVGISALLSLVFRLTGRGHSLANYVQISTFYHFQSKIDIIYITNLY